MNGITVPVDYSFQFWAKGVSGAIDLSLNFYYGTTIQTKQIRVISRYIAKFEINTDGFTRVRIPIKDLGFTSNVFISRVDFFLSENWNLKEDKTFLLTDIRFTPTVQDVYQVAPFTLYSYVEKNCFVDPSSLVRRSAVSVANPSSSSSSDRSASTSTVVLSILLAISLLVIVSLVVLLVIKYKEPNNYRQPLIY